MKNNYGLKINKGLKKKPSTTIPTTIFPVFKKYCKKKCEPCTDSSCPSIKDYSKFLKIDSVQK